MKFLLMMLITHHPDPVTGERKSPADRLREVVDAAVLAEELGYDGFAVGERHEDPFISSSGRCRNCRSAAPTGPPIRPRRCAATSGSVIRCHDGRAVRTAAPQAS